MMPSAASTASVIGRSKWLPSFGQVGGREIDHQPLAGQGEADGMERRPHPLPAFGHRLVAQPHDVELHQARQELRLNVDRHGLDALKCHRRRPRRHSVHLP